MNVSIFQYSIAWELPLDNLAIVESQLSLLPENTDLLILPEMFNTGFSNRAEQLAETMDGKTINLLKKWATTFDTAICGSLIIVEDEKYYNRFVFVTPEQDIFTYDKRHLFSMGVENEVFTAGTDCKIIDYKGWKIKPQVCYDLRFPVWSRNTENYDLLIYVANWPKPRHQVFDTLLHARALENQCYVCASNRIGIDGNDLAYIGESLIIDAKGQNLAKASDQEQIISAEISKETLDKFRSRFPVLEDVDAFKIQ